MFRAWLNRLKKPARRHPIRNLNRTVKLVMEVLEDRMVPTAIAWASNASGNWDVASNWSPQQVPTAGDDVTIDQPGSITVTIPDQVDATVNSIHSSSSDALSLIGRGTLTIAAASQLDGAYLQDGGSLTAAVGLTLTSTASQWSNGSFHGNVINNGTLTLGPGVGHNTSEILFGTLVNTGTIVDINDPAFSLGFQLAGGSAFNNQAGGLIDFQTDVGMSNAGVFNNAGVARKSIATGTTTIEVTLNNAPGGILEVDSGTLSLAGGGVSTGGNFIANANATLVLNANATMNGTYAGSGAGSVQFFAGTIQVANGADTTFNFPAGLFTWGGGTIAAGAGRFTNAGFITLSSINAAAETLSGTLANAGTIIDSNTPNGGFSQGLLLAGSGTLDNLATGLFDFQTDSFVEGTVFAGTGTFDNAGTIRKSAGVGITTVLVPINNVPGSTLEVDTGTLELHGGGVSTGGAFIAKQNASLVLTNTNTNIGTYDGTYTGSGGGTVQVLAGTIQVANGADTTFNFPAGLFIWEGGAIAAGADRFTNAGFITLSSVNALPETLSGTLTNAGTITDSNTPNQGFSQGLLLAGNATLENLATGLFEFQTDSFVEGTVFAGTGAFDNAGTIRKSAGLNNSSFETLLNNAPGGIIDVDSGAIQVQGGGTFAGGDFIAKQGATLAMASTGGFTGVNLTLNGTYTGSGAGSVQLTAGTVQVASRADTTFNFPAGLFIWGGGALAAGAGHFTNAGSITLSNFNNGVETLSGTLMNAGTITDTNTPNQGFSQGLLLDGTATLDNLATGLFDFQTDSFVEGSVFAGTGTFENAGTLRKSVGTGVSQLAVPLNNSGTVEAAAGTLQIAGPISQVSGTILGGGNWVVDAGSTLDLQSAPALTTNNATITFNGIGGKFPKITSLANNAGVLNFLGGADFTFAGDLNNSGVLNVGAGTSYAVHGNFAQTAAGTLGIQVGGTPASSQFGQLEVTGQATLAGTLAINLVNGFGPTADQTFSIVNYAGHTGDFANVTGLGDSRTKFFSETTNQDGVVLNSLVSSADLGISQIAPLPPTGVIGQNVTVQYTVQNLSSTPATGSWIDSVYLSSDGTLDSSDLLLGRVTHTGDVTANGTYDGSLTAPLPAVLGSVRVIVVVDSRGLVPDTNRTNNIKVTADAINATVTTLSLGASVSGTITAGQDIYFSVVVPSGQDVQLSGTFAVSGAAELFERYQALPDQATFDQQAFIPTQANQQILLSATQAGTYYVLVHGREGAGAGQSFTLTATAPGFQIRNIGPTSGANAGSTTLTVNGDNFSSNTTVTLVAGATRRTATSVVVKNSTTLFATFDLTGLTPGAFDVRADDGARTTTASGVFTVTVGVPGHVVFSLESQSIIRPGQVGTKVIIDYSNPGNTDVAAPIILLQSDNARFRLPGETAWIDDQVRLLAINTNGPAGILPPGFVGSITVEFQPKTLGAHVLSNFTLSKADPAALFDWSAVKKTLQPAGEPDDAWDVVFANLTAKLGNTLGSTQAVLDQDATYLSSLGETTPAVSRLLDYEIQQADDFGAITARYTLGALGRGIPDPTDLAAVTDASGNVILRTSGLVRSFTRQSDGTYQGAPGDFAVLTLTGGAYQLREKDGSLRVYNPDGTFGYLQDTSGNRVTADYAGGRLTGFTDSFGNTTTYTYNAQGRIDTITDPVGRVTALTYDVTGQHLVALTDPQGTASITYVTGQGAAQENAPASVTFPDGSHQFFTYDAQGRLIHQESDGGSAAIDISYDAVGRATITDATGAKTVVQPNDFGQIAQLTDPLGRVTQAGFDSNHDVTVLSGTGGLTTTITYDRKGNPTQIVDPLGQTSNLTYDPTFNSLTSFTDPLGNTLSYGLDTNGRVISQTFPDGSSARYSYDTQGQVTATMNRNGQLTAYTYDAHGLLLRETFADGTHDDFTYDAHRNLITISDATGTTTLTYDGADRLTHVLYPTGQSLIFTYDAFGRRQSMTDPSGAGFTTNYTYDAAGRLQKLTDGQGAMLATYAYDAAGRLSRTDNGNGTATTYTYNAAGQILSLINLAADGVTIQSRSDYTYDDLGRPITMATLDGTFAYTYDAVGKLTSVSAPGGRVITYQYDAAGNRISATDTGTTTTYTTNDLNEYAAAGPVSYTYDAAGNLQTRTDATGTTFYSYDLQGNLAGIVSPTDTWSYTYNALGQRVAVTHNGLTTEYLIDPTGSGNVAAEYAAGSGLVAHYVQGLGLAGRVDATGTPAYYGFDGTGNTVQLTGTGGATLDSYSYLPFGEQLSATGTTPNPFTFVGQFGVQDDGSGLYYMRARYYDPQAGRFTQPDQLGLAGGDANLYQYASASPLLNIDPSGHFGGLIQHIEADLTAIVGNATAPLIANVRNAPDSHTTNTPLGSINTIPANPLPTGNLTDGIDNILHTGSFNIGTENNNNVNNININNIDVNNINVNNTVSAIVNNNTINTQNNLSENIINNISPISFVSNTNYSISITIDTTDDTEPGTDIIDPGETPEDEISEDDTTTEQRTPEDPNEIIGPVGFGDQGFVRPDQAFAYTIFFQNKPTASAPAQVVTVTQQLDPSLDLNTFQLGDISFGDVVIPVPAGRTSFSTRYDARVLLGVFVDVTAGVNIQTGLATWTFTSIDPETLDLPIAVLEGFLPPDVAAPDGEGFVSYTVQPKAGLTSGTVVTAKATIVFDTNAPLDTAPISNTIDAGPAASSVQPLPATTAATSFLVSWAGTDDSGGSGIAHFDVFVSDNGGAFAPLLQGTTNTSITFTGIVGHSYGFYSVATDNVGHLQPTPPTAQATTQIVAPDTIPPTSTVTALPAVSPATFTVSWSGSDNAGGSGIATFDIFVSDNGGSFTTFQSATTQTSASFTGAPGHTYGFYSVAVDKAGNRQPTPPDAQTITQVPAVLPPNKRYVDAVYEDLLGRAADPAGLDYWSGQLDQGGARATLINLIDHSAEYFGTIVEPAYQQFLGRVPDPDGLAFWVGRMANGLTDEQLEAGFIGSPEYYNHAGGTDKAWVDAMYMNLLGRQPDPQGEAFWVGQLGEGVSRSSVAFGFAASAEREGQHVSADYLKYLGRTAGQSEIAYWVDQFVNHGQTNEDVITGFVSSDEYYQKKTGG